MTDTLHNRRLPGKTDFQRAREVEKKKRDTLRSIRARGRARRIIRGEPLLQVHDGGGQVGAR